VWDVFWLHDFNRCCCRDWGVASFELRVKKMSASSGKVVACVPQKVRVCRKWMSREKVDQWMEEHGWRYGERMIVSDEAALRRVRVDFFPRTKAEEKKFLAEHGGRSLELTPDVWWHPENPGARPLAFGKKIAVVATADQARWWSKRMPGRTIVVIGPGMAFGTGQHETTAMCLRQLDKIAAELEKREEGCRVVDCLDVGTGSGVLAIAAKKLGFRRVVAIDNDAVAVQVLRENALLNGVEVECAMEDVLKYPAPIRAGVVFANLFSGLLIKAARKIKAAVCKGGVLVLSGIREDQLAEVREAYPDLLEQRCVSKRGWVCVVFKKP
jgi:ribosomal protein L11 methyltransferase